MAAACTRTDSEGHCGVRHFRASIVAAVCAACLGGVQAKGPHGGGGGHGPGYGNVPMRGWGGGHGWHGGYGPGWRGGYGYGYYRPHAGWGWVPWGGVRYGYYNGYWYAPYGGAYAIVRPPYGVVVAGLPAFATVVTIGGLGYWYANGAYYRAYSGGGYEVVPSPIAGAPDSAGTLARTYIYPKLGQSAEKQASDEYECHRWAVDQTGFDPTAAANGQSTVSTLRHDYARAQGACLEGRGYTIR
jgi:hypothetical protein